MNVIHTHLSTFTWLREQRSFYGNVLNVLPRQINFSMWWSNFRELFRFQILALDKLLKTSQNKKDLNDVTAAWFLVRFFAAGSWEKDTKNRAAVMSLKSFLLRDDFTLDSGINIPLRLLIFVFKGAFKYYVIKEVGGWGQKIAIFDDLQYCRSSKR